MFDDDFDSEGRDMWKELTDVRDQHRFDSHEEAAEFVLEWFETYDSEFVNYCESYLARY